MKTWVSWAVAAVLVAGAGVAIAATPDDIHETAPFRPVLSKDGWASSRESSVRVNHVLLASEVTLGDWSATGRWVVINVDAKALSAEDGTRGMFMFTTLVIDGDRFTSTNRVNTHLDQLAVEVPMRMSMAFEIPEDIDASHATLEINDTSATTRLDYLLQFDIDLAGAEHVATTELIDQEWIY